MSTTIEEPPIPSLPSSPTLQPFYPLNSNSLHSQQQQSQSQVQQSKNIKPSPSPSTKRVHTSPILSINSNLLNEAITRGERIEGEEVSLHSNNNNLGSKKISRGRSNNDQEIIIGNNLVSNGIGSNPFIDSKSSIISMVQSNSSDSSTSSIGTSNARNGGETNSIPINSMGRKELPLLNINHNLIQISESQTRRLYEMPIKFSTALSVMCSQHRLVH